MEYLIAYHDGSNKGFGDQPWVLGGFASNKAAEKEKTRLAKAGCRQITIFKSAPEDVPEEIDWSFVNEHAI